MSNESDIEIRERLRAIISESGRDFDQCFPSDNAFAKAVTLVQARLDELVIMADQMGDDKKLCEYLCQRKVCVVDDSVNKIPLSTLVLPLTGRQCAPNGLVALPSRQDTLIGSRSTFPTFESESDYVNKVLYPQWVPPPPVQRPSLVLSLNKIKVVQ